MWLYLLQASGTYAVTAALTGLLTFVPFAPDIDSATVTVEPAERLPGTRDTVDNQGFCRLDSSFTICRCNMAC